jgi:threonine/homoserine/homoserine lactone efflux protein
MVPDRPVSAFLMALLVGFLTGFLGAIPPGPLNVTVIRKVSTRRRRDAYRVSLGGALVDALICGFVGLGFGWILEKVVTLRWVKLSLAVFLIAYGLLILWRDRKHQKPPVLLPEDGGVNASQPINSEVVASVASVARSKRSRMPFLVGLLQGAANPALLVNWTFLIGFLVGHRLIHATLPSGSGFALGVGIGVFGWFALLIELLERLHDHPVGEWIRRSTVWAGVLLILFGAYFAVRTLLVAEL